MLDDDSEEESDTPNKQLEWRLPSTFAVISNPPSPYLEDSPSSSRYPLTDTSVEPVERDRRRRKHRGDRVSRPKPQLWHFGIRSVSGPMEIMVELYKSLQSLGIEWREKRGPWIANAACCWGDDAPTPDGQDALQGASKDDLDIFTVELRWRKRDIVVSRLSIGDVRWSRSRLVLPQISGSYEVTTPQYWPRIFYRTICLRFILVAH